MQELEDIKKIRRQLGLTQSQLARKAGVSQSLIAKIESGRLDPAYSRTQRIFLTLKQLAEAEKPKVKDVMNRKVLRARPDQKPLSLIRKMRELGISQIPVFDRDHPIGLVTESTLLEKTIDRDIRELSIRDVMGDSPPTVGPDTDLDIVSNLLKYFPLVLVMKKGKVRGLVTKSDILGKTFG